MDTIWIFIIQHQKNLKNEPRKIKSINFSVLTILVLFSTQYVGTYFSRK